MRTIYTLLIVVSSFPVFAQPYAGKALPDIGFEKSAGCTPPTTSTFMELNNVSALIHTAGNLWQVPGQNLSQYEVPKNSGIMALFTSALWLGGIDVNNQLKLAALRYRSGQDYWTGPLTEGGAETDYNNCAFYDKHFITTQDEVREFVAWFDAGIYDQENGTNTQSEDYPGYVVPKIIKEWPAHGDETAGQDYYLAPFFDRNEDGTYNWEDGDYPWHDINKTKTCGVDREVSLYGDINYWWVMNDKGNIHTETGADPIGMEIRAQAFAFASNDEINNMTFYNYELINRGTQTLYDTYFGFFTDGALGDPQDDYVGCDVNRGLAYYYNGDNYDGDNAGWKGYGDNPPAVGVDFFEGPYQDNDGIDNAFGIGPGEALNGIGYGDSIVDNERFGMRRFLYYSNVGQGNVNQTDPIIAGDYYNYMRGFWKDGTPFYYGGTGHFSDAQANTTVPCDFMFPGDTDPLGWGTGGQPQPSWTEESAGNTPYDRRFAQSAGPFVLKPGAVNNITVGVVWARASGGGPFASVEVLRRADDKAQKLFENCFRVLDAPHAPDMNAQELENEIILTISNPQNSNNYNEEYVEFDPFIVSEDTTADLSYRFQGYQIFQLSGPDVSISDIDDPMRARLTAQCDIEDDIDRIINFEFDESLNASIPVECVDGENKGIRHSFRITNDLFAQGESRLVNFKRYYFVAIAYAFNQFKDYDPTDPLLLDGQQKKYLASRKAAFGDVKVLEVIPHNPTPEADGTAQNIEYGSTPRITRIDGYGNGGNDLELTQASKDYILTNGKMETPTYEYGRGPINIKVIDPLNVADGYFECKFRDYAIKPTFNDATEASWVIYRYDKQGGNILDSVSSERTIEFNNEQLIPQWGISAQIEQQQFFKTDLTGGGTVAPYSTDPIRSDIFYSDSSKRFLSGVQDNNSFFPTNWIRSGDYLPTTDDCAPGIEYLNPCNYQDQIGGDDKRQYNGLLDGTIAPHKLVGYEADYMPIAYYNVSSGNTYRNPSSISYLPGVDIVLTSDPSKWTRCPVIELGRDANLNIGGAEPGQLRKSPSLDINGQVEGSGMGMSWFPGYAIDVESGVRLYMAFGENSFLGAENGADMLWNPTDRLVDGVGNPLMGGMHPVYVFGYNYASINGDPFIGADFPAYIPNDAGTNAGNELYNQFQLIEANNTQAKKFVYANLAWVSYPLAATGYDIDPYNLPTEAEIELRVNKEYKNYFATGQNNSRPMYSWNMDEIATVTGSDDQLAEALRIINIVPNPYLAYSEYERNRLDSRVKITNLPERCYISIYNMQGKLVKDFKKDSPITYQDWLLINHAGIPISSGVYLIRVEIPGIGSRVLKSYIAMRQQDLQNL
ncbi:MAG: T9SS type A sorting domain-containing protein [Flavobacteriales bacterium]|nr:T9SS type A sorting domain-containing protein [Flavobacteriales bacterium]